MPVAWTAPPDDWGKAGFGVARRHYGDGTVGEVVEIDASTYLGRLSMPFSDGTNFRGTLPTEQAGRDAVDAAYVRQRAAREADPWRMVWCSATTDSGFHGPVMAMVRAPGPGGATLHRVYGRDEGGRWLSLTGGLPPEEAQCWWKYQDGHPVPVGPPLTETLDGLVADLLH
jgi:hypothetical protein